MKKLMIACCAAFVAGVALAVSDWGFNYQAELRNADGSVIVDSEGLPVHQQTVELRLYTSASGGEALWGHSYTVYCDDNGLFNVFLSDSTGSSVVTGAKNLQDIFREKAPASLYVGLKVAGGEEIKPRQRICAVPYAAVAKDLVAGATAVGDFTMKGKINEGYDGGLVPVGGIIIWTKDLAPDGKAWVDGKSSDGKWAICDGANDTPDLRGRFVIGVDNREGDLVIAGGENKKYPLGCTGGEEMHKLTKDEMPNHSHTFSPEWGVYSWVWAQGDAWLITKPSGSGCNIFTHTPSIGGAGADQSHENRPPFWALYYIIRMK